jgi:hypothetical protein
MLYLQICLPLWCTYPRKSAYDTDVQVHHRIVRIPPSESVVLNSAERAPYLLLVEVLHGDMDFDPSSQSNKELLATLQKNGPSPIRDMLPHPSIHEQATLVSRDAVDKC